MEITENIVYRKRLIDLARQESASRILYIQAPAGYGKTIFAGQWLTQQEGLKASVVLDEYDNTPEDLCCKLKKMFAFFQDGKKESSVSMYIEHPEFDKAPTEFLMRAAAAMRGDMSGGVVIDDLHCLTDVKTQKTLLTFLRRLPSGVSLCILSRNMPPESFGGILLKNKVKQITQEHLLFDSNEIRELYKNQNIIITNKQAETIRRFTDGWPIGINALLLSENKIPVENMMSPDLLENFLRIHVWEMWDKELQEFMVGTCMEDELSESLCNVLMGRENSQEILKRLKEEGAFLFCHSDGNYRFHRLFLEFLRKIFNQRTEEYRTEQIRRAGKWYRAQKDFYHAVLKFSYIKDYEQIAECFDLLEDMERAVFDTEQVMRAVHQTLDKEAAEKYPYLYFMLAFTARNEGRIDAFKNYADEYYRHYPQIIKRNPETAHNIFFLYAMDIRITLQDILKMAENVQMSGGFKGVRGSVTLYFPMYHRSFRDFTELLPGDIDSSIRRLAEVLGPLLGEEYPMLAECIRSGLYYEQGNLKKAKELAISAAAKMQNGFAPESKFCVMVLLMTINHVAGQTREEEKVRQDIGKMIEADKAFYLQYNFDAVVCRNCMDRGDREAGRKWLENRESEVYGELQLFRLYGYFTTARAFILLENYDSAAILLEKIVALCKNFKRTVDVIEAEILLAITFWKKKRGNYKKAVSYLADAVKEAQELGCEQVFVNEGVELEKILYNLKNRTMRSDYQGELSETFIRKLYIGTAEQVESHRVSEDWKREPRIQLTQQQKRVAKLMCEGYSYRKIGEKLGIKFSTVRSHIELIYRKLDVSEMREAILKIRRLEILEDMESSIPDGEK